MKEIDGRAKTIQDLLANTKYTLDYYQREYSWQIEHVTELLDDLESKFYDSYKAEHERHQVSAYNHYFLGSIVICEEGDRRFIIDGQQRLTTLTLLLIHLHRVLQDEDQKGQIAPLVFSLEYGKRSFNLDIPDRKRIMDALYSGNLIEINNESESVCNIAERYEDIQNHFKIKKEAIPYFADWLLQKVYLVEITAYANGDAYTIFETMNDRGLSLTPTDMLRGHLLSNIERSEMRDEASEVWSECVHGLKQFGKDEESDAIKAWLRSQHAEKTQDFDRIGSEFHRWVQEQENNLNLKSNDDSFARIIKEDFKFYSNWYQQLRKASKDLEPGFECVYYNAQHNFTLQYPVLLASLCLMDTDIEICQKIQIVATYLDILIHRRLWNGNSIAQRDLNPIMFSIMRDIREKNVAELREILHENLPDKPFFESSLDNIGDLFSNPSVNSDYSTFPTELFRLHSGNRKAIRLILSRITDYVEVQSGRPSRYLEYVKKGNNSYEIEHIWANNHERHTDEFSHEVDFQQYRNCIGGLLLLPKKSNASYGDDPYVKKRGHYLMENLLAQSLHEKAYERNPGFRQFIEKSGLPFQAHPEFKKADLDARQKLYQLLAKQIWNPERLLKDVS